MIGENRFILPSSLPLLPLCASGKASFCEWSRTNSSANDGGGGSESGNPKSLIVGYLGSVETKWMPNAGFIGSVRQCGWREEGWWGFGIGEEDDALRSMTVGG